MSEKKKTGRPSKYNESIPKQAEKLAKFGATDKDLADFFEVAESTINLWKEEHPEFSESLKRGKDLADGQVIKSLYQRATGYEHPDVDIRTVSVGGGISQIVETEIVKRYPPDTTAAIFWLKNRRPQEWRDRQEIDHTSKGDKITPLQILSSFERNSKNT
jgi:hypothetical protein